MDAGAVGQQAGGRERGNLGGQRFGRGPCAAGGDHATDQADLQGLFGMHGTAGEDQVQRAPLTDQARQAHAAAIDQRDAEAPAEHPEHRIRRHHPQVGEQRQLEPAGHRVAFDGGDQRLAQLHPARPHRAVALRLQAVAAFAAFGHGVQVGAGTEGPAAAGEDRDACLRVLLELTQRGAQRVGGGAVDRVARLRPVEGDDGYRVQPFDDHAHAELHRGERRDRSACCRREPREKPQPAVLRPRISAGWPSFP